MPYYNSKGEACSLAAMVRDEPEWAENRLRFLRELVEDAAESGVELDDPRLPYVTVQVDRDVWFKIRAQQRREG